MRGSRRRSVARLGRQGARAPGLAPKTAEKEAHRSPGRWQLPDRSLGGRGSSVGPRGRPVAGALLLGPRAHLRPGLARCRPREGVLVRVDRASRADRRVDVGRL
eukprot:13889913-Alexandrium_andersonii.AAC.1